MIYWASERIGLIFAVFIFLTALLLMLWKKLGTKYTSGRRLLLFLPKLLLLVVFLAALADPYLTVVEKPETPLVVSVLLDRSSSMDIADMENDTRCHKAEKLLSNLQTKFHDYIDFREYSFTDRLQDESAMAASDPGLIRNTDIGRVMVDVINTKEITGSDYIIMLTDGGDSYLPDLSLPDRPLYLVGIGSDKPGKPDAYIANVNAPEYIDLNSDISIQCDTAFNALDNIIVQGGEAASSHLCLEELVNGSWVLLDDMVLGLNSNHFRSDFSVNGSSVVGIRRFRLKLSCGFEELTLLNNSREFSVQTRMSQIKVLYYAHQIGWEFKAVRTELQKSEAVELTALFRLAQNAGSGSFVVQGRTDDQLMFLDNGFPQESDKLSFFQCIIIDSVPGDSWSTGQIDSVLKYLETGGAVIFIGGADAFTENNFIGNDLASVLPFDLPGQRRDSFVSGGNYGVVAFADNSESSASLAIGRLLAACPKPGIGSVNIVGKLKPAADVVLSAVVNDATVPLVVMGRYGGGKVCAMLSNTFWKWSRAGGRESELFTGLWSEIIASLTDRNIDSGNILRVNWSSDTYNSGQIAQANVEVTGTNLPGSISLKAETELLGRAIDTKVKQLENNDSYSVSFPVVESGEYFFNLSAYDSGAIDKSEPVETYTKIVKAGSVNNEGSSASVDHIFLNELASKSGGAYFRYSEYELLETMINDDVMKRITQKQAGILEYRYIFISIFFAVLISEWLIRRSMNLI